MESKLKLSDYQKWKSINSPSFNTFDYIFCVVEEIKIPPDFLLCILDLIYPAFTEVNGRVFLNFNFSSEKLGSLEKDNTEPNMIEYWMNIISLENLFPSTDEGDDAAREFCKQLAKSWRVKLANDFPEKSFEVLESDELEESGDLVLSFRQTE